MGLIKGPFGAAQPRLIGLPRGYFWGGWVFSVIEKVFTSEWRDYRLKIGSYCVDVEVGLGLLWGFLSWGLSEVRWFFPAIFFFTYDCFQYLIVEQKIKWWLYFYHRRLYSNFVYINLVSIYLRSLNILM